MVQWIQVVNGVVCHIKFRSEVKFLDFVVNKGFGFLRISYRIFSGGLKITKIRERAICAFFYSLIIEG